MMIKRVLLLFAVMAALFVGPVVAYDNETEIYEEFYRFEKFQSHDTHDKSTGQSMTRLYIENIENYVSIQTVFYRPFDNAEKWVEVADATKITGIEPVTLRYDSKLGPIIAKGTVSYYHGDTPSNSHVRLDLDTWYDVVGTDTGSKNLYIELPPNTNLRAIGTKGGTTSPDRLMSFGNIYTIAGYYQVEYTASFQHKLTLTEESSDRYRITYFREFGKKHDSIITITDRYGNVTGPYHDSVSKHVTRDKSLSPFLVNVVSTEFGTVYRACLGPGEFEFDPGIPPKDPGDPGDPTTLTVYIKNSQTGALIANSNIVIDALVNNEYYPVVNRSEPSGIFTINLQPTGGGPPNPDGYRLIVTADGYNNPMPEINFTVDDYKQSIYCLLDPISGGPEDENKTFIDFFVSDMYANPISGATVKFGKYTLITNSAGYTVFEVPKNDYYTYTVIKSGYNHLTGNAVIGDAPRNTINTYLTPVITPPTQPTGWPTDPPTQPTGGIPDEDDNSDSFMMQAVRGIANLFGVSFGIGKNILGMLLALGIGTATAKQLKGGAQEFGMGMLGGVVLGVLIGLLPIWVLVLLVLIVGLWIGQRYMSGGDS